MGFVTVRGAIPHKLSARNRHIELHGMLETTFLIFWIVIGWFIVYMTESFPQRQIIVFGGILAIIIYLFNGAWWVRSYSKNQNRIFEYCHSQESKLSLESREWINLVKQNQYILDEGFPRSFYMEEAIPPQLKSRMNEPTRIFLKLSLVAYMVVLSVAMTLAFVIAVFSSESVLPAVTVILIPRLLIFCYY